MIRKISSIAVVVKDEKKAKEWYRDKLGFEVRSESGHWITVAPEGSRGLVIHLCKTRPLEKGNTGILFTVANLNRTYSELRKKGVKFETKPRDDGWGAYAMMKDLDGNVFWLME